MGRSAKFDRSTALSACMRQIWQHGYEASSIKAIAEMLGITRSSFYHAFHSREELLREVLSHYFSQAPDQVLNDCDDSTDIPALLTRFFYAVCRVHTQTGCTNGCLAVNCINELVDNDPELGPWLAQQVESRIQRFEYLLEQARKRGQIAVDTPINSTALALQNLLFGLSTLSKVVRSEKQLHEMVEVSLRGLGLYVEIPTQYSELNSTEGVECSNTSPAN